MDDALLQQIQALTASQRIELLETIWEGIAASDEARALSDARRAELQGRFSPRGREPVVNLAWDEAMSSSR